MPPLQPGAEAPALSLPATTVATVTLADLLASGPAILVFATEECPTSALTLRRLAPVVRGLATAGPRFAVVYQEPLDVAARAARKTSWPGAVLSEPPPYDVAQAYGLETVPTTVLVDRRGGVADVVVGWDGELVDALLARGCELAGAQAPPSLGGALPTRKPGCVAKNALSPEVLAALQAAGGPDEMEEMFDRGWTDGLPTVPPTRARVDAMLAGRDGSRSLGEVPPVFGEATLDRVAACAVLAGCRPDYFPVVVAAVEAALDPRFNLHGQGVTTQPSGQLVIVNGPVREAIGLNSGMGVLGPGWRANATIGRALRLVVTLTGGAAPGRLDRSTLGQPGKLSACIAEDEAASPWEPLHVERRFDAGQSVVTLLACDAPLSISDHRSTTAGELARVLGWAAAGQWSPNWWPLGATSLYVVCPEHAAMFRDAGWTKDRLRSAMFEAVGARAGDLSWGETTPVVKASQPDALIRKWDRPDDIMLVVAGGEAGRYSAVFGPCSGMQAQVVSREVEWER